MNKRTVIRVLSVVAVLAVGFGLFQYARWIRGYTLIQKYTFMNATLVYKEETEPTSRKPYRNRITFTQEEKPILAYWIADPTANERQCPKEYTVALPEDLECIFSLLEPGKSYEINLVMRVPNPEVKNLPLIEGALIEGSRDREPFDYYAILSDPTMYREYIRVESVSARPAD